MHGTRNMKSIEKGKESNLIIRASDCNFPPKALYLVYFFVQIYRSILLLLVHQRLRDIEYKFRSINTMVSQLTLESATESALAPITEIMLGVESVQPVYANYEK
jgi:hypothetical protein